MRIIRIRIRLGRSAPGAAGRTVRRERHAGISTLACADELHRSRAISVASDVGQRIGFADRAEAGLPARRVRRCAERANGGALVGRSRPALRDRSRAGGRARTHDPRRVRGLVARIASATGARRRHPHDAARAVAGPRRPRRSTCRRERMRPCSAGRFAGGHSMPTRRRTSTWWRAASTLPDSALYSWSTTPLSDVITDTSVNSNGTCVRGW